MKAKRKEKIKKDVKKLIKEFKNRLTSDLNEVEIILLKEIYLDKILNLLTKIITQKNCLSISDLKSNFSIVDVFSQLFPDTQLRKSSNKFYCLCPFHQETNPSFFLYPETNTFYCFGCQVGGDVIELVKKALNCNFEQAIKYLTGGKDEYKRKS